jgi:hypothetical protein
MISQYEILSSAGLALFATGWKAALGASFQSGAGRRRGSTPDEKTPSKEKASAEAEA